MSIKKICIDIMIIRPANWE